MRGVRKLIETIGMVIRVFSVWIIALFLPRLFMWYGQQTARAVPPYELGRLKVGLENISPSMLEALQLPKKRAVSVGLLTTTVQSDDLSDRSLLFLQKGLTIKKLFVPWYKQGTDFKKTSCPVTKLTSKRHLTSVDVKDVDLIMVDIQDASMPYTDYMNTLLQTLRVAATTDKKIMILDRPNMLGGVIEGAAAPVPLRHGMTVGELAHYYNKHVLSEPARLCVVPMENYSRSFEARELGSSSYVAQAESWYSNSLLGMLAHVKPFDLALETDQAFQCILLPDKLAVAKRTWDVLSERLKDQGIESSYYRYYNKQQKEWFSGLHLFIASMGSFSSYRVSLLVMQHFQEAGVRLAFSKEFDELFGTDKVRAFLEGKVGHDVLVAEVSTKARDFFNRAFDCFMYKPLPKIITL